MSSRVRTPAGGESLTRWQTRKWPSSAGSEAGPRVALVPVMRCLAFTSIAALLATSLVACTDGDPYLAISDAPGPITLERDPLLDWSSSGGTLGFYPPGTATLPELFTLRLEGRHVEGGDYEVNDPLRTGTLEVVEGSACRLSAPLSCRGGICFAELELTQFGLCMVRAGGLTDEGSQLETCWYYGTWEQDPADPTFEDRMGAMTESAFEACLDG